MELATARKADELAAVGYRVRVSDEELQEQVLRIANMTSTDPAEWLGALQQAAKDSVDLPAKIIAYGSLTGKVFQDASLLAQRIKLGDWSAFGSKAAAEAAFAKRLTMATTMLQHTSALRSSAGRQLRALRGKPFDPAMFEGLAVDRMIDLAARAGGNVEKLKYLKDPSLPGKVLDTIVYLRIGSLISGWTTQAINVMSNGYMLGARPLERILGSMPAAALGHDAARSMIKTNLKQYAYMGSALMDGFGTAVRAFMANESIIRPHGAEAFAAESGRWQVPGSQALNANYFKPWDSTPNIIHNALSVPLTAAGVPSRVLGGVDELMKQIVYRSKLMANAHVDGVEQALEAGLRGKDADEFVKAFVKGEVEKGFDETGRGLNKRAMNEANTVTFQQDLLPGTLGRQFQTAMAHDNMRWSRLILPFIKTPTNVIRYAVKLTPGLNLVQSEYRAMLWGQMGAEAQAQALGQMTMGALFMGSAAYLSSQGMITGGGPSDPKTRAQLLATGWRPYSIVSKQEDGTTRYYPYNRFDPIALPFGIIADIQDALHILGDGAEGSAQVEQAIKGLGISLAKQFSSRTYLMGLNQALDALNEPDRHGEAFFGNMAASLVPFSAMTRQTSSDPYLRDARSITDKMLQVIPGLSETLPPRYDWLGQPMVNRQGLWTDDNGTLVDKEVQRLSLLPEGSMIAPPSPALGNIDLRDITLTTGGNAYQKYQELSGKPTAKAKPLRSLVANVMRSKAYQNAPDGDVGTRGTKLWMLHNGIISKYRTAAGNQIRMDKNVREALMKSQRKVADHYQHLKVAPKPEDEANLKAILDGFGAGKK